jgi:general stress protein 26
VPSRIRVPLAALLFALAGCATRVVNPSPLDAARQLMTRARYCALITAGDEGHAQARTIDPSPPDARMVVTFVTNPATRKVRQIELDPRVTLYYFDERSPGYVTVIGMARRIDDPETKQRQWLQKWTPFYPGGGAAAVLYEVTPQRIEVVDVKRGIVGDPQTWSVPYVDMKQ